MPDLSPKMTVSKPSMPISTISIWHALQLATGEAGRLRDLTGIEAGQLGSLAAWQLGSLAAWQWLQICTLCHRSQRKKTRRKGSKGAPAICCQSVGTGTNSNYLTATAVFGCSGVCDVRCEVCQVAHCHACHARRQASARKEEDRRQVALDKAVTKLGGKDSGRRETSRNATDTGRFAETQDTSKHGKRMHS